MIKNLILLFATIFFIMGVGEWLFPKFIGKLPLRLYGPVDWDHFNKRGYQVLSDELVGLFPHTGQGIRIDNCVD